MSFFTNLFASQQAAAAAAPTPMPANTASDSQPGDQPTQQATTSVKQPTAVAQHPENPLDFLMQMSQNTANDQPGQAPKLSIPQETLATVAKTLDYTKAIPPEALQALQNGDMSQLGVILNSALQAQYQTIMQHQSAVTDKFVTDHSAFSSKQMQQDVRTGIVDSSLKIQDLHPMAQQMFRSTAKNLASQFPEATPQDIEEQTWAMMEQLGNQFNRTAKQQQTAQKASEVDWDNFGGF